jgi:phosphatidylserine/phosphatidylglycerophosphate/cardiolipin synthase-like enzyme
MNSQFLLKLQVLKHLILPLSIVVLFQSCNEGKDSIPIQTSDFCSKIHLSTKNSLSFELQNIDSLMQIKTGVYVLEEGSTAMMARASLTEHSEKTIDIQYFIFSTDNVGLIACDFLVRAADRGVKVRILVDDLMVDATLEDIQKMNSHENIEIKIYNPGVNLGKNIFSKIKRFAGDFNNSNKRMHNKTFIVDGKIGITGGRNIADEYFDFDHEYNFRDRDVLLFGKGVKDLNKSFSEFWTCKYSFNLENVAPVKSDYTKRENLYENLHQYACNPKNYWPEIRQEIQNMPLVLKNLVESNKIEWLDSVYFVSDIPGKNGKGTIYKTGGRTTDELISLLNKAKHTIDIQTPYLVTTRIGLDLFKKLTIKGVKIRILTNSLASTDNLEAFSGYKRDREKLLATGVEIYEFKPDAAIRKTIMKGNLQKKLNYSPVFGLHAKSMVIDNKISVIGTFNLDPRSANLNTECLSIIYSNTIVKKVMILMNQEFSKQNAWRITTTFNPDYLAGSFKRAKLVPRKLVPKFIL